jgi:hypothetical protein
MEKSKRKVPYEIGVENVLEIPGYPIGSDITVLNVIYIKPYKDDEGNWYDDYITIIFKDNVSKEKHHHIIYQPKFTFFKLKKEYGKLDHNLFFIEKDKVDPITCRYKDILKSIAILTGQEEYFYNNIRNGNPKENDKLHTIPDIFASDTDIEDYYRSLFARSYTNNIFKINKAYLDIEVDGSYSLSEFPEPGEVPINAVAYYNKQNNTVYQFLLNDPKNKNIKQYRASYKNPAQIEKLKEFIISAVGGHKNIKKFGLEDIQYKLIFFDDEILLIKNLFDIINITSPDMLMVWNNAFDFNYIINRIKELGENPLNIICDKRIEEKFLKFYIDQKHKNDFEERGDYVKVSSYTVWIDQMINFASRRKGRAKYPSFRLNAIGYDVAKVNKLDYSHITTNLTMLPYLDYEVFSFYNIMDVMVQNCIESITNDCEYIFAKSLANNVRFAKVHRQSIYLSNRFSREFYEDGYIIGNNKNRWNEKPSDKFPGAMVGDPLHNSTKVMVQINGNPTLIADNMVDFDYTALYPSAIRENNIAPNTQIGKINIEEKVSRVEHQDMYSSTDEVIKYSRGGEFLEDKISCTSFEFYQKWFWLADVPEMISDMKEFYKNSIYHGRPIDWKGNEAVYFIFCDALDAVTFNEDGYGSKYTQAVKFDNTLSLEYKNQIQENIRKEAIL